MKRTVVALSLLGLALTGCGQNQSGGSSNPDSQVVQPPLPGSTADRTQGPDPSKGPVPSSSNIEDQTGGNGATTG